MEVCGFEVQLLDAWELRASRSQPAFHGWAPAPTWEAIRSKSVCVWSMPGWRYVVLLAVAAAADAPPRTQAGTAAAAVEAMPRPTPPSTARRLSGKVEPWSSCGAVIVDHLRSGVRRARPAHDRDVSAVDEPARWKAFSHILGSRTALRNDCAAAEIFDTRHPDVQLHDPVHVQGLAGPDAHPAARDHAGRRVGSAQ